MKTLRPRRRAWLLTALTLIVASGLTTPGAATLPSGFVERVVAGGFQLPVAFAVLPDGRMLIAEKSGLVRLVKNGAVEPTPFVDLRSRVNDYWDRGLLGLAVDPSFGTTGYVYLYYVWENDAAVPDGPKSARLTRLTAVGDTASLATEVILVGTQGGAGCAPDTDCIPADSASHNGGGLLAAADGTLYLSTGDAADFFVVDERALRAQDRTSLAGKLLHVDGAGRGLPINPFWTGTATANESKVLAYGFRNPFRLTQRPSTGSIYVGDVGWEDWEEIDVVTAAGGNYGWPCYEGHGQQSGYGPTDACQALYAMGAAAVVAPLHVEAHNGQSRSIVAGAFAPPGRYPEAYQDALFFGDYAQGTIGVLTVDASDQLTGAAALFASNAGGPVDIHPGPEGDLYYLDILAGELRRLSWEPDGTSTQPLSEVTSQVVANGWGPPEMNRSNGEQGAADGRAITLNGQVYVTGIGVHAPSEIRFALDGNCTTLTSDLGVDDEVGNLGSVVFQVWADGLKLYDSGLVTGATPTLRIAIELAGRQELVLIVTDGGDGVNYDHADWAGATLACLGDSAGGLFADPVSHAAGVNTHGVALADLDGDGALDMVAANAGTSTASVWRGNGDGTFATRTDYPTGQTPKQIAVGDLNGDGLPDLISANQDAASVSVLLGSGGASFGAAIAYPACSGTHESALGDFNGDGHLDVIVACWGGSVVSVLMGRGDGTLAPKVDYAAGSNPHSVVVGDFDADGVIDAAIANHGSGDVSILRGRATGIFMAQVRYAVGIRPHSIRLGDLDGDGALDLATANEGSDSISVLRGAGGGLFAAAVNYPTGKVPKGVAIADVTGDGRLDLMTANTAGSYPTCCQPGGDSISVLRGNAGGGFDAAETYRTGLTPFALATGDVDGDGDLDVATANWHSNDVAILTNLSDGAPPPPPPPPQITGVSASGITTSGAQIRWTTDTAADGQVEYGTTTGYGSLTPVVTALTTGHDVALTGLMAGTSYHYRVHSRDADGRLASSGDHLFTTTSSGTGGGVIYLSDLSWTAMTNGWGPVERDRSNGESGAADGQPLTLNGVIYPKGLGAHALSDVRYAIPSGCTQFQATVGVDDEVGSQGTVTFTVRGGTTVLFASATLSGASASVPIAVDLTGHAELRLAIGNGGDNINYDHADWADARFICDAAPPPPPPPPPSTVTYLSDLAWTSMTNGWGPIERDRSNGESGAADGRTLTLNGVTYAKGLGAHGVSDVRYAIPAGCTGFRATVGVDDEVGSQGSVTFTVSGGTTVLFTSATLGGASASVPIAVDLTGHAELRLAVGNGGDNINYDHADWADARFICNAPPAVAITAPAAGFRYKVGDVIALAATAEDPEDGSLTGDSVQWNVILHHCPGDCHSHPFMNATGTTAGFTVPDHGDDNFFEIVVTATDSAGAAVTAGMTIHPQTVVITLDTMPSGLQIVYGGITGTAPMTRNAVVGSTHTIVAPSPQGTLVFESWSDGGARQHNIVVGTEPASFVATFTEAAP